MNLDALTEQILAIDSFVRQPFVMPLILVVGGGLITLMTGVVQIRRFPLAAKIVFGGAFGAKGKDTAKTITPFQALSTARTATVGNGNIGGVVTAILIGGPGAVFWMWFSATVGMATKFAEAVLGVHYPFMAFPNLIGLAFLLRMLRRITVDFFERGGREYNVDHPTTGAAVRAR